MMYGRAISVASALLILVCAMPAFAQNTRSQESKKARLEKEIALIDSQLRDNTSKSSNALSQLSLVRKKIANRNELIAGSDRQIQELSVRMAGKQREIDVLQNRLDTLSAYYSNLVLNAYKNRDSKVWYMYILSSENIGQAFRRVGYLRNLSAQMNVQARKIKETTSELQEEKDSLKALRAEAQALRNRRVGEVNSLKKEEAESDALVSKLKKENSRYRKELASKKKQVDALNREIERIIREATKGTVKKGGTFKPRKPIDYKLDGEFAKNKGKLPWPAEGPVVDRFGQRNHPVFTNVKLPFNNGVSVAVPKGTQVKAVFDGEVRQIVVMPGYNKCVLVQHGNYFSFYCKLGSVEVKAGDKLKTNQVIGTVDTMDGDTQLHFQIWQGTKPQNPEVWLRP